ncbi:MAG: glycerate kinase [Dehalococcoidia bacterium]|nr:MAG: glycerate kinase [Dehalococcoidia bacterium]
MKIVVAHQLFKDSLSAPEVARAMALGIKRVAPDAQMVIVPLADAAGLIADAAEQAMRLVLIRLDE